MSGVQYRPHQALARIRDKRRARVTGPRLYALILASSVTAAILPFFMILSKLAANDFFYLELYRKTIPPLAQILELLPWIDPANFAPWLPNWSWHAPWDHAVRAQ